MKITKRQLKRIIKEEKTKLLQEMNQDGTISGDEDTEREALLVSVEDQLNELIAHVITESNRIGGDFRSPGIKKQVFDLMYDMIGSYRR
jgi:hypothetical protein